MQRVCPGRSPHFFGVLVKIVVRGINTVIFGIKLPFLNFPNLVVIAADFAGGNIGVNHQQRIGTLCPFQGFNLFCRPGSGQRRNTDIILKNLHLSRHQANQINLLGIKFKRDQPAAVSNGIDIAQPVTAGNTPGGKNNNVLQRCRTIGKDFQVAASQKLRRNLSRREIGFGGYLIH